jgi:uncharacterized membrane protein YhfC
MHYLLYFVGPFVLAAVGLTLTRQRVRIFGIGLATFFLVWIVMQAALGVAMQAFRLPETSLLYALVVSGLAGLCEEPARYLVFSQLKVFRGNRTWRASLAYALGHHGMETIIVGLTLLLTTAVVRYKPDAISDPATLQQARETAAVGAAVNLYLAIERLFVGLLIHACFSGVVMLAVATGRSRWLAVAMLWHFAHNLVGFGTQRLPAPEVMGKAWIAVILVSYTYLLIRIYHALGRTEPVAPPPDTTAGPPSLILPGRSSE